ncbi:MAG TPA: DNA repair protein RecO [Candidatus Binatia bacterium]|nr:DNA repair protein RecO [Candidatus Binatia bacterium]
MPGSFTDVGIVLRRVDYGEADRVLTVLTREHGKVGVIARGVRRTGSRLAARTDLFECSRMQLVIGRGELLVLAQAQRAPGPAPRLVQEPRRAACAAVVAELTDRVLEERQRDEEIFDLVEDALESVADPARDARAALVRFARQMIGRLGYAPQLHRCAACGGPLPELPAAFSAAAGGLLCPGCRPADPRAVDCPVRVIKVLRVAAEGDDATWERLRLDPATLSILETIVERELEQHLDRRLRSWEVLRALGG